MINAFEKLNEIKIKKTSKQKLVPIKERKRDEERSYMLWINKNLLKELKLRAVKTDNNVKNIIEEAIKQYFKNNT